jgi:hypothetical protein
MLHLIDCVGGKYMTCDSEDAPQKEEPIETAENMEEEVVVGSGANKQKYRKKLLKC